MRADAEITTKRIARVAKAWVAAVFVAGAASIAGILLLKDRSLDHLLERRVQIVQVVDESLDFGEVWASSDFSTTIRVRNSSTIPLTVNGFESTCACRTFRAKTPCTIPPGQTVPLDLQVSLVTADPDEAVKERRPAEFGFYLDQTNGLRAPRPFVLHGVVKNPLSLAPPVIQFGDSLIAGALFSSKSVTVGGFEPLIGLEVECPAKLGRTSVKRKSGATFEVMFTPADGTPEGPLNGVIVATGVTAGGRRLPPAEILVTGTIFPSLRAVPSTLDFGPNPIGSSGHADIIVQTLNATAVQVEAAAIEPIIATSAGYRRFKASADKCEAARAKVTVSYFDLPGGRTEARLRINVREHGAAAAREIMVPLSAYGTTIK